jgi:hypothetical protein
VFCQGKLLSPKVPMSFMGGWAAQFLDRKRNLANRGVVYWGKRCQTLWDGGLPFKIDPKNLDSFFLDDIDQRLQPEVRQACFTLSSPNTYAHPYRKREGSLFPPGPALMPRIIDL